MTDRRSPAADSRTGRLLIVDDEAFIREAIELYLVTEGFEVLATGTGPEALLLLEHHDVDLAILDIMMPGMDGIQLLRELKKSFPDIEVVMASGCGTLETAVEAMRLGAYDYISKPILNFDEDLLKVVKKALERRRLVSTNRKLTRDLQEINRELKRANGELKRRMAEFEILYDNGRLLGDLGALPSILEVIEATLVHQLDVKRSMVLLEDPGGWKVSCAPGFEELTDPCPLLPREPAFLDDRDGAFDFLRVPGDEEGLTQFLAASGATPAAGVVVIPLRAGGDLIGLLFAFEEPGSPVEDDRLRLLKLLGGQISAPLALHRERISS